MSKHLLLAEEKQLVECVGLVLQFGSSLTERWSVLLQLPLRMDFGRAWTCCNLSFLLFRLGLPLDSVALLPLIFLLVFFSLHRLCHQPREILGCRFHPLPLFFFPRSWVLGDSLLLHRAVDSHLASFELRVVELKGQCHSVRVLPKQKPSLLSGHAAQKRSLQPHSPTPTKMPICAKKMTCNVTVFKPN